MNIYITMNIYNYELLILFYSLFFSFFFLPLVFLCHYNLLTLFIFLTSFLFFSCFSHFAGLSSLNFIRSRPFGFVHSIPLSKIVSSHHVVLMQVIATDPIKFTDWCYSLKSYLSLSIRSILFDFFILVAICFYPFFIPSASVIWTYDCYCF